MKSSRSFLPKNAFTAVITAFVLLTPSAQAANIWDGGGTDNNTTTASNWDNNAVPTTGTLTFAGTVRPTVAWNGINSVAPVNLAGFTFAAGASSFQINSGTQSTVQFVNGGAPLLNNSSNLQTLGIQSHVFFNGIKTFNAGTAGLALNGGIVFRGDSMTSGQTNTLALIGSATTSTVNTIGDTGNFVAGALMALTKSGTGTWTVTGAGTFAGTTTITQGKLSIATTGSLTGSGATRNVTIGTPNTAQTAEFNFNSTTALGRTVAFASGSTGGTLSGGGTLGSTIAPTVNVTTGNTLAIGATASSVGVMNFGTNLTVGGTYLYDLNNTNNTADLGDVAGTLTLGGILDLVQLGTYAVGDKFTLFAYDGVLSGLFRNSAGGPTIADDTIFTDAGGDWRLNYNDTTFGLNGGSGLSYVTITAIPEPSAALLGVIGGVLLFRRRR